MNERLIPKSDKTKEIEESILNVESQIAGLSSEKEKIIEQGKKLGYNDEEIEKLLNETDNNIQEKVSNLEIKESFKIGTQTFENEAELYKYLNENAVDKENNLNLSFFDYTENNWPEPKTISAINEWTENFKAKKREINKQNETSEKEVINDNKDNIAEEKISPEEIKNLEELLGNIEKERIDKLEDGPLSLGLKKGVIDGLEKWEKFGQGEEGPKGFAKRFTKMAVNLVLIGAISSISVQKLAEAGIGTAAALSGGVTSYLGRKMSVGLGLGSLMELGGGKIPDKVKKWIPVALGVAGVGAAIVFSGGLAGVAAGLSAGAGYATSKLIKGKFTNEKISEKQEKSKQVFLESLKELKESGEINTISLEKIEEEYTKILKKYENQRIWGKLLDGATKLGVGALVSGISLEASGFARDIIHHQPTVESVKESEIKISNPDTNNIQTEIKIENPNIITSPITQHINVEAVADHGQGAISTLRELQHNLKVEYRDNLENAPESVKHILETDPQKLAQEYGMYKPGQDAESAFIKSGSSFKVDESGNVIYHEVGGSNDITLEKGTDIKVNTSYEGKMADTDHSEVKAENTNLTHESSNEYKVPEQVNPITGEEVNIHTEPINLVDDKYKLPPQVNPVTGQPIVQEGSSLNNSNLNIEQGGTANNNEVVNTQHHIDLSTEELQQVHITFKENINHIFPENEHTHAWDNVKDKTPDDLFKIEKENGLNEIYKPLTSHLHKLQEATGLSPRGTTILNPIPETNTEYIERALQKAQEMGQLDEVKL